MKNLKVVFFENKSIFYIFLVIFDFFCVLTFRMKLWVLLWACYSIVVSEIENEELILTKHGVILHKTNVKVFVLKDSVLVTFIYDTDEIRYIWNEFIEYSESLTHSGLLEIFFHSGIYSYFLL